MGSGIEFGIGFGKFVFLYVISGLGGILLSMNLRPNAHGVGASTAVFGLVGFLIAYILTNWQYMGRVRTSQRVFLIVYCSVLVVLNLNIGPGSDPHIDNFGHLGGLITGFFAGFAISEQFDAEAREKNRHPDRFTEEEYRERPGCSRLLNRFC
jgi:rhomboid protease GluP